MMFPEALSGSSAQEVLPLPQQQLPQMREGTLAWPKGTWATL